MRPTRSDSGQHLVQGVVHRGLLFRVERVHGAHQNFEWITRQCFFALARQSQTYTPPIRFGLLSDQVPACHKRLDGLSGGAARGRLKLGEGGGRPGERVRAGEEPQRHPLGRAEVAVIGLGLHEPAQ